jgi:predicted metalloendopeptidase
VARIFELKPDDVFGNEWRADLTDYERQVARLGKGVDRHEWSMTPQTVDAVQLPMQNALNFPAAILHPPFFDPKDWRHPATQQQSPTRPHDVQEPSTLF